MHSSFYGMAQQNGQTAPQNPYPAAANGGFGTPAGQAAPQGAAEGQLDLPQVRNRQHR
jgi:hypothetical protein